MGASIEKADWFLLTVCHFPVAANKSHRREDSETNKLTTLGLSLASETKQDNCVQIHAHISAPIAPKIKVLFHKLQLVELDYLNVSM